MDLHQRRAPLLRVPKLVKIRAEAGVKAPEFIYLDQLEAGTL